MRKNSVLFLIPTLTGGGAERVLINLLNRIDTQRFRIDLVVVMNKGDFWQEIPAGIHTHVLFQSPYIARLLNKLHVRFHINFLYRKMVRRKLQQQHYDVGISFSDGSYTDILFFLQDRISWKVSWVHSCYTSYQAVKRLYSGRNKQHIIDSRCKKLDEIVFVSHNAKKEYMDLFGEYPNMRIVYNVIDKYNILRKSEEHLAEPFDTKVTNIITVGNLLPVKGYMMLIDAVKILVDKGHTLKVRIIGKGPLEKALNTEIRQKGLEHQIELTGFRSNPYPYMAKSDIYVMPSKSEAFPMSLIEAMVAGLPVVTTDCSGGMEITDNGRYGLVSSFSPVAFAENIETLLTDDKERAYFARLAVLRAAQFDEENIIQQVYEILEKRD